MPKSNKSKDEISLLSTIYESIKDDLNSILSKDISSEMHKVNALNNLKKLRDLAAVSIMESNNMIHEESKRADLEALIRLNISKYFKAAPKALIPKLADDIQEQFYLSYKAIDNG